MRLDPERWRPPVAIAHRGSRLLWPENTDIAFTGAHELGYRHFETDLQLTADGELVCFHDDSVDRTTEATGRVDEFTLQELQALDAGYRHATPGGPVFRGLGAQVPTLEWLLAKFPDVSVVVDLKTDGLAARLASLLDDLGAHERLIVGSFRDERLREFCAQTDNCVPVSSGSALSRQWVVASQFGRGVTSDVSALQLPTHMRGVRVVSEKLVDAAHGAGLQVHVWTVNDPSEMTRLLEMGVDGLVTDRPDLLKDVLVERGEWRQ
jgi:glycerophosphoryl diester phosphodiesterase